MDSTDFPPHLTPDKIQASIDTVRESVFSAGYSYVSAMPSASLSPSEFATQIKEYLAKTEYKIIVIGNGVRSISKYFLHFEAAVNAIHEVAPKSTKIAFNHFPSDTLDAVKRWI